MTEGQRENFSGDVSFTAAANYTKGLAYQLSSGAYAVALETKSSSEQCLMALGGSGRAVRMTKVTGTGKSFAIGSKVYSTSGSATPSATGNTLIGFAVAAAATTDTEVVVVLCGLPPTAT